MDKSVRLTFDVECSNLAADRVGVDCAAIWSTVATAYFTDKQVPLFQIRPHDVEPRVVDDSSLLVCQREGVLVEPRHLQWSSATSNSKSRRNFVSLSEYVGTL